MCELRFEPKIVFLESEESQKALLATLKAFSIEDMPETKKEVNLSSQPILRHVVLTEAPSHVTLERFVTKYRKIDVTTSSFKS